MKSPRPFQQGKGQLLRPPVNSYHSEVFFGGLELLSSANEDPMRRRLVASNVCLAPMVS